MTKFLLLLTCVLSITNYSEPINSTIEDNPVYSVRLIPFYEQPVEGCHKMQLSIYATYPNGQVLLKHTAVIQSGQECKPDYKLLNSEGYSKKSGPEYIVKDEMLNGPIEDFIAEHKDLYREVVLEKEKLMAIKQ